MTQPKKVFKKPYFKELVFFMENYNHPESSDQRSIEEFAELEAAERILGLKAEILMVAKDDIDPELLDKVVGKKRQLRYGTYKDWASYMLRWLSGARR